MIRQVLRNIQQEKFFFVARLVPPFSLNLRPDFCGSRPFFQKKKRSRRKTPDLHVFKPIITAKITPKTVPATDSAYEAAAGTNSNP
jgi:hypothetical protein